MRNTLVSLLAGLTFGAGLVLGGMTQPSKVIGFLSLGHGWDPSLALVMGGALGVHALAYRLVPRLGRPLMAERFAIPTRRDIDGRLLLGAALFGAGWGLGGYCPGPAIAAAVSGATPTLLFVAAMLAGMALQHAYEKIRLARTNPVEQRS